MIELQTPISEEEIRSLHTGDVVSLSGVVVTARDAAHKLMIENFIRTDMIKMPDLYEALKPLLDGGLIYHCGPVVSGLAATGAVAASAAMAASFCSSSP